MIKYKKFNFLVFYSWPKAKTNNPDTSGNQKINENNGKVKKPQKERDERSM